MKIALIVAMDKQQGIGKNNDLMWHLPNDMRFFKETTQGHLVVMGRKNYESIPEKYRPLANRENVVLTRNTNYRAAGCRVFHDLGACIEHYIHEDSSRILFIIGGGEIYRQALEQDWVEEMYITHVNHTFDADTFFPEIDWTAWKSEVVMEQEVDDRHDFSFVVKRYLRS